MSAAWQRLRARGGRTALAALGVLAAAAMLGTGITVAYGLHTGFERSARQADLPDVIARFDAADPRDVDRRVRALPNLAGRAYRFEATSIGLAARGRRTGAGNVQVVRAGRRGYAVVAGRDLSGRPGEVLVERGLAREWGLRVGGALRVGSLGPLTIVGEAVAPDNVAFPLARTARVYVAEEGLRARFGPGETPVTTALLWARDPSRLDVLLTQARTVGFGLTGLRFVTRSGVRVLLDEAAGVVIALLVAFAAVTLAAAGVMLGASAHAEVQRRLSSIGVLRALGFSRGQVTAEHALDAALLAAVAGALGLAVGAGAAAGPSARLLGTLNELPPGSALLGPLAAGWAGLVALVVGTSAWPAWRASGRPVAVLLRGPDLGAEGSGGARVGRGWVGLGARLAVARPARLAAAVGVLAAAAGVVLLMLAVAGLLERLRDDPGTLGKRYALTAALGPESVGAVRALPGVADAGSRYVVPAADSFALGQTARVIAYPGDHTRFEAPPLATGRRLGSDGEAEVGVGLADALGLAPGATLALAVGPGREVRFRVTGTVRALENDGRVAYVRPARLLRADPGLTPSLAVRLRPGADRPQVEDGLRALGAAPVPAAGASSDNKAFLGVLAALLRLVAGVDALVCLYALVQVLALTARERRATLAVLRAVGAGRGELVRVMAGVALTLVALAAPVALALQAWVLGPGVARLAASYGALGLRAGPLASAGVALGLVVLALAAAVLVARRVSAAPVVAGLRAEAA